MASRLSKPPNRKPPEDAAAPSLAGRILSARRDTVDFQDLMKGPGRAIREFALYTLTDKAEQDDHCARVYNKSLLYLVSRAFEERRPFGWGWPGTPLLGMEKFIRADADIKALLSNQTATWVLAPNHSGDPLTASGSTSHGGFDNDRPTLQGTIRRILGSTAHADITSQTSASRRREQRAGIQIAIR